METFNYTLDECWNLSLPDLAVHMTKQTSRPAEPDWFIDAWKTATDPRQQLEALQRLMG